MDDTALAQYMRAHRPHVVFYHTHCNDGLLAALTHKRFYDEFEANAADAIKYIPMPADCTVDRLMDAAGYNGIRDDRHLITHFLDLSITDAVGWDLRLGGADYHTTIILDHHGSAIDKAPQRFVKVWGDAPSPGVNMYLDIAHSGCVLTAMALNVPVTKLAMYVEDRDLWKWQYPEESKFVFQLLTDLPPNLIDWDASVPTSGELAGFSDILRINAERALYEQGLFIDKWLADHPITIAKLGLIECQWIAAPTRYHSELGNKMALADDKRPAVMIYPLEPYEGIPDTVSLSIRSTQSQPYHALQIMNQFVDSPQFIKGGGHEHAANVKLRRSDLPKFAGDLAATLDKASYDKRN